MAEDRRLLSVEQIARALAGGAGTTVTSESGHGWTLRTVKAGGPKRAEVGGPGWLRLRFEAAGVPVSQVVLFDMSSGPECAVTGTVDA